MKTPIIYRSKLNKDLLSHVENIEKNTNLKFKIMKDWESISFLGNELIFKGSPYKDNIQSWGDVLNFLKKEFQYENPFYGIETLFDTIISYDCEWSIYLRNTKEDEDF